jgi:hypothetical protein
MQFFYTILSLAIFSVTAPACPANIGVSTSTRDATPPCENMTWNSKGSPQGGWSVCFSNNSLNIILANIHLLL